MKAFQHYKVNITDRYHAVFELSFTRYQYPNLRALIANNYPEEFGECRGRGLCGTCHVKITRSINDAIEPVEIQTLKNSCNANKTSRLACQILLDEKINKMNFEIITED